MEYKVNKLKMKIYSIKDKNNAQHILHKINKQYKIILLN